MKSKSKRSTGPRFSSLEVIAPVLETGLNAVGLGRIASAAGFSQEPSGSELAQRLRDAGNNVRVRTRTRVKNPGTHVLKFSEAIKCVEKTCEAEYFKSYLSGLIQVFSGAAVGAPDAGAQILAQKIVECMESKLLEQMRKLEKVYVSEDKPEDVESYTARRRGFPGSAG